MYVCLYVCICICIYSLPGPNTFQLCGFDCMWLLSRSWDQLCWCVLVWQSIANINTSVCLSLWQLTACLLFVCMAAVSQCPVRTPGRNAPLIQFLTSAPYTGILFGCLYRMLPHLHFFHHFFFSPLLLIFSFENRPTPFPDQISWKATKPGFSFSCLFCAVVHFFYWWMRAFILLGLVFSWPSQEIGLGKRLRDHLFCVAWDVKPQLKCWLNSCVICLPTTCCAAGVQSVVSKRVIPVCTMVNVEQDIKVIAVESLIHYCCAVLCVCCPAPCLLILCISSCPRGG